MIEGLWTVKFIASTQNLGAGAAVFSNGRILGGDSHYYYVGDYEVNGSSLKASISVINHSGQLQSVFGAVQQFQLQGSGSINDSNFDMQGEVVGRPGLKISVQGVKRV